MKISKPIITKEHGAWAVLFVPLIIGSSVGKYFSLNILWLFFSALFMFLSYVPVHLLLRTIFGEYQDAGKTRSSQFWGITYVLLGTLFIVPLLLQGYWLLLLIGALGGIFYFLNFILTRYIAKSVSSDLFAVAGLTLGAPSSYYIASGAMDMFALFLWFFTFLFFACSVFYVHMKITAVGIKKKEFSLQEKFQLGKLNIIYHLVMLTIVAAITMIGYTRSLVLVLYVPISVHALIGTIRLSNTVSFKKLGMLLLAHSILFCALFIIIKIN